MSIHKQFCILLLLPVFTFSRLIAQQHYNHGMFWGRLVLADQVTDKLKVELYGQKRTQNIPGEKNILGGRSFYSSRKNGDNFDSL